MLHRNKIFLFLLLIVTLFLLIPSLDTSIRRSDEGIYANVTHEMLEKHEPFAPTYFGNPYYNKLPLRFWISYATNSVIGEHNFSYRIPEILFALALVFLIVLYGKKFLNKYSTGILAGALFITSEGYLVIAKQFTTNNLTLLLNVWVMGLLWSWYNSYKEKSITKISTIFLISILSGLTFFTRTIYAFLPGVIFFCFLLFKFELLDFIKKEGTKIFFSSIIFLGTIFILFLPLLFHYDLKDLINTIFISEVYDRAISGYHNTSNYLYYFERLLASHYAITPLLLISSLLFTAYKSIKKNDFHLFLFVWAIVPIIVFSLAKSHLAWYILISFPAFALIAANFIISIFSQISKSNRLISKIILSCIAFFCCILCYSQFSYSISHTYIERKGIMDLFSSNINNYKGFFLNPTPLAIEDNLKQKYLANKTDRYYITLIEDKSTYLSPSEIINAIENNRYDFYLTSFELFEEINKRFHPKGIILNYARKTFLPKTAIFSFNHGGEFAPLTDNVFHQLNFSLQDDGSYLIKSLSKPQSSTLLTMTFNNFCVNEKNFFIRVKEPARRLRLKYFYGQKIYVTTVLDKTNYQEEIIIKPEKNCFRLFNATEGIDINKMLTVKPYNQAVNSVYPNTPILKLPKFPNFNPFTISE